GREDLERLRLRRDVVELVVERRVDRGDRALQLFLPLGQLVGRSLDVLELLVDLFLPLLFGLPGNAAENVAEKLGGAVVARGIADGVVKDTTGQLDRGLDADARGG